MTDHERYGWHEKNKKARSLSDQYKERNERLLRLYRQGYNQEELSKVFVMTQQRVSQILAFFRTPRAYNKKRG